MTWQELGEKITQMSEQEKQQRVVFIEGYDEGLIQYPSLYQCVETFQDWCGNVVKKGEWYLDI